MNPDVWLKNNYETFKLDSNYFKDMNVIISLANEYVENSTDQPVVVFHDSNMTEAESLLAEALKNNPHKFKIKTKTGDSEYTIDVKIQNENDWFKIKKYGRIL
jgi:hypothetical protein